MSEVGIDVLPPVAKSFYTLCKKCEVDRYHTVLTHTTEKSAKIKCEVCKATRTYTLPKAQKAAKPKVPKAPRVSRSESAAAKSRLNHQEEYQKLIEEMKADAESAYNMKSKFTTHEKIAHPKFGLGIVTNAFVDKVEVMFPDEVKTLVHNRA